MHIDAICNLFTFFYLSTHTSIGNLNAVEFFGQLKHSFPNIASAWIRLADSSHISSDFLIQFVRILRVSLEVLSNAW